MNNLLREIIETKKKSLRKILDSAGEVDVPQFSFREALVGTEGCKIIAELKQASPSRGLLVERFDPGLIARQYREGGACALSVLTDEPYFKGSAENVALAKAASELPALCKDFFVDPEQVGWARRIGADAVLLIVRILSPGQLQELLAAAREAGLATLVETHTEEELERAISAGCEIIGVNCRDLDTFETDLEVTLRLSSCLPDSVISVAESAIHSRDEIVALEDAGYNGFLIGESLMTAGDRVKKLMELRGDEIDA